LFSTSKRIIFGLLFGWAFIAQAQDTADINYYKSLAAKFDINSQHNLDSSLFYLHKATVLAEQLKSGEHLYSIYDYYSRIFQKSGNYALALEYLFKMMAFIDNDSAAKQDTLMFYRKYASLCTQIGLCYFNMNNFKSLDYYTKSLEAVRLLAQLDPSYPSGEREVMIYINIGSAYLSNYDFDQAEQYFERALELNAALGNLPNESSLYNNLGIVAKEKKDFNAAFNYYFKSLEIRSEMKDSSGMAQNYNNLGDAYFLSGEDKKALEVLNKALQISRKTGNINSWKKAAYFLSIVYERTGDYQKSLEMYRTFNRLNDSIINTESIQNAIRLEMQYLHDKQVREYELEQQLIISGKERQTLIYMVISGFLLTSLLIVVLLYRNQRMSAKQNALERQNLEMELEFRNKELSTHVMYLLKKNEFISAIAEKLVTLSRKSMDETEKSAWIQDILREMQSNVDNTVWNEFEIRFQQVHKEFYRKLMQEYPDLTPNEIKICAFLKLNMTNKDISAITFQSVKSLEVARHRLRKKMGIDRDDNLVAILQNL
jgi:tetratricopeptide (TPR) repeat protein